MKQPFSHSRPLGDADQAPGAGGHTHATEQRVKHSAKTGVLQNKTFFADNLT